MCQLNLYICIGYILPTIWGIYLPTIGEYICQLLAEYIQYKNISPNCWQNISNTNISIQLTYIPQWLAEYIQYQYINSTNIYSSIVGRIYPISEYIPNFWQNISNTRIYPIPIYIYIQLFMYSQFMPKISPIYPPDIPKISKIYPQNMSYIDNTNISTYRIHPVNDNFFVIDRRSMTIFGYWLWTNVIDWWSMTNVHKQDVHK